MTSSTPSPTPVPEDSTFAARLEGASLADLTRLVERALRGLDGADRPPMIASFAADLAGPARIGDRVIVSAAVDRVTRTLIFARADIRRESDQQLLLAAQLVLKVPIR